MIYLNIISLESSIYLIPLMWSELTTSSNLSNILVATPPITTTRGPFDFIFL